VDKTKLLGFPKRHPILFNLMLIGLSFLALVYAVLLSIDVFTDHGEYVVVPDLKGKSLNEAELDVRAVGFKCEITDSTYNDNFDRGAIVDQEPKANSKVKANRTIYLTINAFMPRKVSFPRVVDMSCRQGRAVLEGLGFKNIKVDTVSSPYKDLIINVKVDGRTAVAGERLPLLIPINLSVGSGGEEVKADSIGVDSLFVEAKIQ